MARKELRRIWRFLTRLKVASVLVLVVLLLAALGSCFPQLSTPVAADASRLAEWQAGVRTRYGSATQVLAAIQVFSWFRSPLFLVSVVLLCIATLVCTLDRWRAVWRRAMRSPPVSSDVAFNSAPYQVGLVGSPAVDLGQAVRNSLRERGFRIQAESAPDVLCLRGDRHQLAALATLVTHLAVLLLLLGAVLSSTTGWREELTIESGAMAEVSHGRRFALRNDGFHIARYADGSVSNYQVQVALIEEGQEVARGSVQINQPLVHRGVALYLRGYQDTQGRDSVTLAAVHDVGYGPVIVAGFLLLFGITVSFSFPRCWVQARIEPGPRLRLAGWADRWVYDFGDQFTSLARELAHTADMAWEDGS